MTKSHVAPAVSGIDLDFAPPNYFMARDLGLQLPSDISGQARREIARAFAETGEEFPPGLLSPTLSHEERAVTASIHPSLMGGEYLPALRDDEVEIVRLSLQSTTCDQISLRARRAPNGIAYALVDEYEGDYIDYRFRPRSSRAPLTMGEVVTGLDRACSRGGAVMQPLQSLHKEMGLSEEHRYFVAVESDFYPELGEYYKARIDQFLASNGVGATGST